MKFRNIFMLSIVLAVALSVVNNREDALENLRFNLHVSDRQKEIESIKAAIKQYNKNSAGFYNSGGVLAGLEEIPAVPLLKRRLFKDITMLKGDGLVMVFDKDAVEVTDVIFKNKDFAEARTHEVWAIALQNIETREAVFNIKAVEINVRYVLRMASLRGEAPRWIVYEVDVFPKNEKIPELNIKPVL